MNLADITPLIITFNEEDNLERTLAHLDWASQILVVDSGSTDRTLEILSRHRQVKVVHRAFDTFAGQCNFGLSLIETPWVLSLDADYVLTTELLQELASMTVSDEVHGYSAGFDYWIMGRALRGSLYPPRTVLYRRGSAVYRDDGHGHRVQITGSVFSLKGRIAHDDRKSFSRWLSAQDKYAIREAHKLTEEAEAALPLQDRLRLTCWAAVPASLVYTLLVKGTILDGWRGWYYALQRVLAEMLLALRLIERKFKL